MTTIIQTTYGPIEATPPSSPATIGHVLAAAVRCLPDLIEQHTAQHGPDAAARIVAEQASGHSPATNQGVCLCLG